MWLFGYGMEDMVMLLDGYGMEDSHSYVIM